VPVFARYWRDSGHWSAAPVWLKCKAIGLTGLPGDAAMKIDGACHCGLIAYEAEADPETTGICHCTDCQTLSGSAFRTVVASRRGSFKLRSGEPKIYVKTAESGTKRQQGFCPNCGTPIYSTTVEDGPTPSISATNWCQNCSTGFARPNIGPMISAPYRRLKSNANSTG
jgi:hypothetical protein